MKEENLHFLSVSEGILLIRVTIDLKSQRREDLTLMLHYRPLGKYLVLRIDARSSTYWMEKGDTPGQGVTYLRTYLTMMPDSVTRFRCSYIQCHFSLFFYCSSNMA